MKNIALKILLILLVTNLAACSAIKMPTNDAKDVAVGSDATATASNTFGTPEVQAAPALPSTTDSSIGGTSIGGAVEQAMDATDKSKMLHAMDKAPGKSTHWVNQHSQLEYTVTPTKKVRIQDKSYCRQYQMTAVNANGNEQNVQGIACIASDGDWHVLQN
jgi:surface antigen